MKGNQVCVVVSAMGDTTDDLIELAEEICPNPPKREMDQLLATGEQVTIALMAMAIHAQGHEAISFTGGQIGLVTDNAFQQGPHPIDQPEADFRSARLPAKSSSSPASRASPPKAITPPWAAAAAMPRSSPSARFSKPMSARTTPMSTASSPPTRGS